MHPDIARFFHTHSIPNHLEYPTGKWVQHVYEELAAELFPVSEPSSSPLPPLVSRFAYLRSLFAEIGVQISYDDLADPDRTDLEMRLNQIGDYLHHRAQVLQNPAFAQMLERIAVSQELERSRESTETEIVRLQAELAKDSAMYEAREAAIKEQWLQLQQQSEECKEIDHNFKVKEDARVVKLDKIEELESKITAIQQDLEAYSPFIIDGELVRNTVSELEQAKKQQQVIRSEEEGHSAKISEYKTAIRALDGLKLQINPLRSVRNEVNSLTGEREELVKSRIEVKSAIAETRAIIENLVAETEDSKASSLTFKSLEHDLTQKMNDFRKYVEEQATKLQQEEEVLKQELESKNEDLLNLHGEHQLQTEHNNQIRQMLEHAPKRLRAMEVRLDEALEEIGTIKV